MLMSPVPDRLDNRDVQLHAVQRFIIPSQANSANPTFCLAQPGPVGPLTLESSESTAKGSSIARVQISNIAQQESSDTQQSSSSSLQSQTTPTIEWPVPYLDSESEFEDSENIEARILNELAPDRQLESNTVPFIVHCFAAWMARFVFDPTRILPFLIHHIRRGYSFGDETRQTMLLISNSALAISESTDYNLAHFNTLHMLLVDRVADIRARDHAELTREVALGAMEHSHQFISTLFKVGSLANVLNTMELYAPVFRRACPESDDQLVNLPRRLTAMEVQLKYFSALDVLQSVTTHRPMFFRYNLDFLSPQEETFIKSGNGPGLRWLYGVPDRLMVVLARMNILFEDFGNRVDMETVRELEEEIGACEPVVCTGVEFDPALNLGRMVVQEAWRLAANIYLYMALCGADSTHPQVVQVQKKFMKFLRRINPCRNPDSFLVLPILILSFTVGRSNYLSHRSINSARPSIGYFRVQQARNGGE
ncbi:unnamed protein product [Rhizoctonia solani]|uniref:Uncharacterized protein n=1 Tax=Rhizoctonia solani TaxID=456999 RepID=A0A8H2WBI7_9AGAM|nr:unnamed protein product [Rhizoctonia solani]